MKTGTSIDAADERIVRALRQIARTFDLHSQRLKQSHGVTVPQLVCLRTLLASGPMFVRRLAEQMDLSASTVVGILDRLELKGYARRERDTLDRRTVRITITPEGERVAGEAPSLLGENVARGLRSLPQHEQADIARSLEHIVLMLDARETADLPDTPNTGLGSIAAG